MTWGNKWQDRLSHKFLIPRYVHRASRIICVSASVRREVLDLFEVSAERVSTVYYGVDDAFFEEDLPGAAEATRERLGLTGPYFLDAGHIYPPKNMMRLLEAFARVGPPRGFRLAIAGEPRWLCEQEMARMEEADLAPWITRAGWCDRPTLRALYRGARALVLPSLYEGFGLPIVEAMAAGWPHHHQQPLVDEGIGRGRLRAGRTRGH